MQKVHTAENLEYYVFHLGGDERHDKHARRLDEARTQWLRVLLITIVHLLVESRDLSSYRRAH